MKGLGICDRCGTPYPVMVSGNSLRVMGNAGACTCGSRDFSLVTDDDVADTRL